MAAAVAKFGRVVVLMALGLAIAAMGIYVANADDAPGAAVIGFLLMLAAVVVGVRMAQGRVPAWAGRVALAVGIAAAAFAAFMSHAVTRAAVLFDQPPAVPSVLGSASSPQWSARVDRARAIARGAIVEQNLPGVSIAVGAGGRVVWAEGFGWRDVVTQTPVTPETRFNIGTAASEVQPALAPLGLADTGTDSVTDWSPEHVGEPEEDFPPLAILRHVLWQPLGLMPAEYPLPGDRATFYVPRSDDNPVRGRRLMRMRDLACCEAGRAFYSTPSDLVRFAMATNAGNLTGELAGGSVMSLVRSSGDGVVVAVTSNIAHARTAALAANVAGAFAE